MAAKKRVVQPMEGTMGPVVVGPVPIQYIPVDFPNEGLNNLARKLNEVIDRIN